MYNIIGKRFYWYILSAIMAAAAIVFIAIWGLRLGIDFKGGSVLTVNFTSSVNATQIKDDISSLELPSLTVLASSDKTVMIRTAEINKETKDKLSAKLSVDYPGAEEESFQSIGPVVSKDLTNRAIWAVILATLGIIIYMAIAFRGVPKPANSWQFGLCAVGALLHDLLIVTGVAALLGHFFSWMEIDSLFITALLTILGFSVHDTIVVFDRLRENLKRNPGGDFEVLANESIIQTLSRSINTSVTTMLVLATLFVLGGASIKGFIFTLLFGILIGTYSSIFNATPLLVSWQKQTSKRSKF